jgi:hypothetical protein
MTPRSCFAVLRNDSPGLPGFAAAGGAGDRGAVQRELEVAATVEVTRQSWPRDLPEQFNAMRTAPTAHGAPLRSEQVADYFIRARRDRVAEVLETLVSIGQVRNTAPGRYAI